MLAFVACEKLPVRLLIGKRSAGLRRPEPLWLDPIGNCPPSLASRLRSALISTHNLDICMVRLSGVGGEPVAYFPMNDLELSQCNHFQPLVNCPATDELQPHFPWRCTCGTEICQSPLDEALRPLGHSGWFSRWASPAAVH